MSNFWIKVFAAVDMVIDHIGAVFFPDVYLIRYLGRLSFPLFAWLIGEGEKHTKDVKQYGIRLLIFGLISQPAYSILFDTYQLNILFTLMLGLLTLRLGKYFENYTYIVWAIGILVGAVVPIDFDAYGIVVILLMANFRPNLTWWITWVATHSIYMVLIPYEGLFQLFAIPAPIVVQFANYDKGRRARWFYWFYPVHLCVLLFVKVMMN
ncbi:MAG TPA: TraX family protein [Elainellaceae cyanobacterium]